MYADREPWHMHDACRQGGRNDNEMRAAWRVSWRAKVNERRVKTQKVTQMRS